MITIKLSHEAYAHKDTISKVLEDEVAELRLYYDYEIIEDDDLWGLSNIIVVESKLADKHLDVQILLFKIRDTIRDFLVYDSDKIIEREGGVNIMPRNKIIIKLNDNLSRYTHQIERGIETILHNSKYLNLRHYEYEILPNWYSNKRPQGSYTIEVRYTVDIHEYRYLRSRLSNLLTGLNILTKGDTK